jgi:hypothetical protein
MSRKTGLVVLVVASLVALLSYAPARTAAAGFLTVFRAERVQVVALGPDDIKAFEQALKQAGVVDLKSFGKVEVSPKPETRIIQPGEAQALAGFTVRLPAKPPAGYELKQVSLSNAVNTTITPDVQNLNSILAALGTNMALPAQLAGKQFVVKSPAILSASYADATGRLNIVQAPSPELIVPEGVDVEALRKVLLSIPALPAQLKQQLSMRDWQRTVLVPGINGSTQEVSVNGSTGAFITSRDSDQNVLLWQQNGIWCAIFGRLTLAQAQAIALGLK